MLAALLADASGNVHKAELVFHLLQNQSLSSLLTPYDLQQLQTLLGQLFAGDSNDRTIGYNLLLQALLAKVNIPQGTLLTMIDRIATHIDSIQSPSESQAFLSILQYLLASTQEDILNRIEKAHVRLITTALRILQVPDTQTTGLELLVLLVSSPHHSVAPNTLQTIKVTCLDLLTDPATQVIASQIMANLYTTASSEHWNSLWSLLCNELNYLLGSLGLLTLVSASTSVLKSSLRLTTASGVDKGQLISRIFHGICIALDHLLNAGNTHAFITLDLSLLLPIASTTLQFSLPTPSTSNWTTLLLVENKYKISPAMLLMTLPALQTSLLILLHTLILSYGPSLSKHALQLCKPLTNCLCTDPSAHSSTLNNALLNTLATAIKAFPSMIPLVADKAISTLATMFTQEISQLTASKTTLLTSQSTCPWDSCTLLHTLQTLLLYCGYCIPPETLSTIEIQLHKALQCLLKGTFESQVLNNRKIQRALCEPLREHPEAQKAILTMSLDVILCCHTNGMVSGLVSMLKRVAELSLQSMCLRSEATRVLSTLDMILMPTAIAIPAVNLQVILQEAMQSSAHELNETLYAVSNGDVFREQENAEPRVLEERIVSGKRKEVAMVFEKEEEESKKRRQGDEVAKQEVARSKAENMYQQQVPAGATGKKGQLQDESDDESLPDITM